VVVTSKGNKRGKKIGTLHAASSALEGMSLLEYIVPGVIGLLQGFALAREKQEMIKSMYDDCDKEIVHTAQS
jgi:hypothetical protein